MLQTFPSGKINVAKNLLFFLLIAPLHHSFTFYSQFLYELNTSFISLKLCVCARAGVFVCVCVCMFVCTLDFVSFLLKSIFLFNKKHGLFDFKTSKLKIINSYAQLCSQTYDSSVATNGLKI